MDRVFVSSKYVFPEHDFKKGQLLLHKPTGMIVEVCSETPNWQNVVIDQLGTLKAVACVYVKVEYPERFGTAYEWIDIDDVELVYDN